MGLRLEIISRQRQSLRGAAVKEFGRDGGTIGRSLQTDWPLPDAQRFLSSRHATIEFHSGSYYIIDTSTNGVFINDATQAVGKGKPQRLFTGDRIRVGDYELSVDIDSGENTMETCYAADHVDPVVAAQHVESPDPTGHDLVDAFEITGVGIEIILDGDEVETLTPLGYSFDTTDLELADEPAPAEALRLESSSPSPVSDAEARPASTPEKRRTSPPHPKQGKPQGVEAAGDGEKSNPARKTDARRRERKKAKDSRKAAPKAASPASAPASGTSRPADVGAASATALIKAFCDGAGIDAPALSGEDARRAFHQLGQTVEAMLSGIVDSIRLRALQKAQLHQPNTVIQPGENNLLKFSASGAEALARLLDTDADTYMPPVESVRETFADLNAHQKAMLKVLPAVLNRYIEQLDPEVLEQKFASAGRNRLLGPANKLRYWDLYRDVYLVMSAQASDELPEAFTDMLSAAYESEVERSKAANEAALMARKVG